MTINRLSLSLGHELTVQEQLACHWDDKLTPSHENPYPLAPVDLVREKMVTDAEYHDQNDSFGKVWSEIMVQEIQTMITQSNLSHILLRFKVLGLGLLRDLDWTYTALSKGCILGMSDISDSACEHALVKYAQWVKEGRVNVINGEILDSWDESGFDHVGTVAYFASQFVQVLPQASAEDVLSRIGRLLQNQDPEILPRRRLYIVHPFGADNVLPVTWKDRQFPGATWGDTTPYEEEEIRKAITAGNDPSRFRFEILGKHNYFHQKYSMLKVSAE